ncbi:MAG: glutathione S-transferase family protein [Hyphomicrobiaceae bacterium]|nr:MAG: glutathione S-transferase family protein [Hyphomicrobiaceae bacterium]
MAVELHGYRFSVYAWIARFALCEKGAAYKWVEVNPFAEAVPASYLAMHPFGRVPTLVHDDFVLYETGAITRYVDEAFEGPVLQRPAPKDRARTNQIISVIDSYAYWPLVRQVFSHGIFRSRTGRPADNAEFRRGLEAAPKVLGALDRLATGGDFLVADGLSLADIHLAPMIGYFTSTAEGEALLRQHQRLSVWWSAISRRGAFAETMPKLPESLPESSV